MRAKPAGPDRKPKARQLVRVTADGPYLVTGGVPLSVQLVVYDADGMPSAWRTGREFDLQREYALCRCGRSQSMPYCDGSHARAGFDGAETASRQPFSERARLYSGAALELTDVEDLCASARFCERAGGTWKLTVRSRHPEARRLAIEEAGLCPSGRLVALDREGRAFEPEFAPSIGLVDDPVGDVSGPIWVRGGIPVVSADGQTYEVRNRVTLCRCGRSRNKPFCDGSHEGD